MIKQKVTICIAFILLLVTNLKAQENSPYTRFGVGNLSTPYPVDLAGYGGLTAGSEGQYLLNYANPASYASLYLTTFSIGVYATDIFMQQTGASESFQNGTLTNVCLGFPIIRGKWGASFGLVPYSRAEYSVANINNNTLGYSSSYDSEDDSGALYKLYIGTGYQIKIDTFDHINVGINGSYLFGTFSQSDDLAFIDTSNTYNTQHMEVKTLGGFLFQGGIQYIRQLSKDSRISFGFQGNLQTVIGGRITDLYSRWVFQDVGNNGFKDTIESITNQRGNMVLPASMGAGIVYTNPKFVVGVNWDYTYWSNFSSFGQSAAAPVSLVNSWRLAFGGQWIPTIDKGGYNPVLKKLHYSAGFFFEQSYLAFYDPSTNTNKPINQAAITLGVWIPLSHRAQGELPWPTVSSMSVALEFGKIGTLNNGLLLEDYGKISIGFTLNDLWFIKRKFD